jgi:hypothetical protein
MLILDSDTKRKENLIPLAKSMGFRCVALESFNELVEVYRKSIVKTKVLVIDERNRMEAASLAEFAQNEARVMNLSPPTIIVLGKSNGYDDQNSSISVKFFDDFFTKDNLKKIINDEV